MGSMSLTMSPKVLLTTKPTTSTSIQTPCFFHNKMVAYSIKGRYTHTNRLVAVRASPEKLSSIEQSIKDAQQTCADDPVSGECAAAWDEVEEVSAAASHARDKAKPEDPLETYCKDNPETDECRTYDN